MLVALGLTLSAIVASAFAAHPPPRQARLSPAAGVILNSNVTITGVPGSENNSSSRPTPIRSPVSPSWWMGAST